MRLSVVLGEWLDRPIEADLAVAVEADRLGYGEVWIGEMAKLDAPAMAAAIVARTSHIEPVLGPLAVTVRSPAQIALATATVAATGRRTHVALGTSSDVVAHWHGRDRSGAVGRLATATTQVRALLDGERVDGFRLRQPPAGATLTVAAFGPRAVAIASDADRMVLNMVTVDAAGALAVHHPHTAAWLAAAVDPTPEERRWLALGFVAYLGAPGYGEMFAAAGFADLVAFARTRPHPKELAARLPDELIDTVAVVGSESAVRARIDAYAAAGLAEIGLVVPPLDSPSGPRTLEALAP
ncbi:MAG: LLM class F420-dependent oxidoreductase [Ilumatobacteraceae bacterium]